MLYYCMKSTDFDKVPEGFNKDVKLGQFTPVDEPYIKGALYVVPVFRSATTNEFLPIPLYDGVFTKVPVTCESGNEAITYQVMDAVFHYVGNNLDMHDINTKTAIRDSFFQPYGLLKTNDSIIVLVNIVIKDDYISLLTNQNKEVLIPKKFEDLKLCTNLSEMDKLILPTLIITK